MKIKILEPTLVGDLMVAAGETVDITDEGRAKYLIGMKLAEEVKEKHSKPIDKTDELITKAEDALSNIGGGKTDPSIKPKPKP